MKLSKMNNANRVPRKQKRASQAIWQQARGELLIEKLAGLPEATHDATPKSRRRASLTLFKGMARFANHAMTAQHVLQVSDRAAAAILAASESGCHLGLDPGTDFRFTPGLSWVELSDRQRIELADPVMQGLLSGGAIAVSDVVTYDRLGMLLDVASGGRSGRLEMMMLDPLHGPVMNPLALEFDLDGPGQHPDGAFDIVMETQRLSVSDNLIPSLGSKCVFAPGRVMARSDERTHFVSVVDQVLSRRKTSKLPWGRDEISTFANELLREFHFLLHMQAFLALSKGPERVTIEIDEQADSDLGALGSDTSLDAKRHMRLATLRHADPQMRRLDCPEGVSSLRNWVTETEEALRAAFRGRAELETA